MIQCYTNFDTNFTEDIEDQVVGVILDLASPDSLDDYRTEAVAVGTSISLP